MCREKHWDILDKTGLVGDNICQGKNNYNSGGVFQGLLLSPKTKYCLTVDKFGIVQEHRNFNGFNHSKRLLDHSQNFKTEKGENILAMLPRSWKK